MNESEGGRGGRTVPSPHPRANEDDKAALIKPNTTRTNNNTLAMSHCFNSLFQIVFFRPSRVDHTTQGIHDIFLHINIPNHMAGLIAWAGLARLVAGGEAPASTCGLSPMIMYPAFLQSSQTSPATNTKMVELSLSVNMYGTCQQDTELDLYRQNLLTSHKLPQSFNDEYVCE
jgi:hypothetical protein